jgi:hypothetical protein
MTHVLYTTLALFFCVIIAIVPTDDGLGGSQPKTTMILYRFLIIYLGVYFYFFSCVVSFKNCQGGLLIVDRA